MIFTKYSKSNYYLLYFYYAIFEKSYLKKIIQELLLAIWYFKKLINLIYRKNFNKIKAILSTINIILLIAI